MVLKLRYYILDNEIKHAMQKEESQYRFAISISSRAAANRSHIRDVVQESGLFSKQIVFLISF